MTPQEIIRGATKAGVTLSLTPAHTIKATGDIAAVGRWLPVLREHKAALIKALAGVTNDHAPDLRRLVEAVARANPAYWTPSDIEEAVAVGMRDYDNALMTFRALAAQYGAAVH